MGVYLDLLRYNRNYRHLWLGFAVTQLGDWFNLIATASLIEMLSGTGTAVSYLFLARFLPLFLFSPLAGVLADRYDRRSIMIRSNLVQAVVVLGFLFIRQEDYLWLLYLLIVTQFALAALFTPARTAVLANIVQRKNLVAANALDSLTWSAMLAFGALLGGVVTSLFGIQAAFIINSIAYVASTVLLAKIIIPKRSDEEEKKRFAAGAGGWLDFVDGLRYLRGEKVILGLSLVKAGGSLAWGAINVLEVTFAHRVFPVAGSGDATLGLIYAVSGLGTGLGPILMRQWFGDNHVRVRWGISVGFLLLIAGNIGLSTAPDLGWFLWWTLVRTVGSGTVWVFSAALLQMIVPERVRGRVFAFEFGSLTLMESISIYWAGFAQDEIGFSVHQVTFGMGLVALAMGLSWFFFYLRTRNARLFQSL